MQPQLKKLLRTYQSLITTMLILILSVVGLIVGVIPLFQKTMALFAQNTALAADVASLQNKTSVLESLDEQTLRNDIITLASAVPPDKSLMTLLSTVDSVTGTTGVTLTDLSLTKPGSLATDSAKKLTTKEAAVGSNVLPFVLSVNGSYDQIRAFLTSIITVRRIFRMRSLDVSVTNGAAVAHITMDAFYYPFPTAVGALTKEVTPVSDKDQQIIAKVAAMPLASGENTAAVAAQPPNLPVGKTDPFGN